MVRPPEQTLEPEANYCREQQVCTPVEAVQLSTAISLKRIADALDESNRLLTIIARAFDNGALSAYIKEG